LFIIFTVTILIVPTPFRIRLKTPVITSRCDRRLLTPTTGLTLQADVHSICSLVKLS